MSTTPPVAGRAQPALLARPARSVISSSGLQGARRAGSAPRRVAPGSPSRDQIITPPQTLTCLCLLHPTSLTFFSTRVCQRSTCLSERCSPRPRRRSGLHAPLAETSARRLPARRRAAAAAAGWTSTSLARLRRRASSRRLSTRTTSPGRLARPPSPSEAAWPSTSSRPRSASSDRPTLALVSMGASIILWYQDPAADGLTLRVPFRSPNCRSIPKVVLSHPNPAGESTLWSVCHDCGATSAC